VLAGIRQRHHPAPHSIGSANLIRTYSSENRSDDQTSSHRASMKTDDLPASTPFEAEDRIAVLPLFLSAFFLVEGCAGEGGNH
jgi:hypothetical protein